MIKRVLLALKGSGMGFADSIPGVSGGTMALILGVYEQFISALSAILSPSAIKAVLSVDFWKLLLGATKTEEQKELAELVGHVRFMINLGVGIVGGIVVGILILPVLMDDYPTHMRGFFFGLVFASIIVPWNRISKHSGLTFSLFAVICLLTYGLMGLKTDVSGTATTKIVLACKTTDGKCPELTLDPDIHRIATDTGQKKTKREIMFQPTEKISLSGDWAAKQPKDGYTFVSLQSGKSTNVDAGSLVQVFAEVEHHKYQKIDTIEVKSHLPATGGTDPSLLYVFICGAIAICAMILPGISGSFLLLMLGMYGYILHTLRNLITQLDTSGIPPVLIFIIGILTGLTLFSRFLKWLLANHENATMAALAGLMLGSLRALWPFQQAQGGHSTNVLPQTWDGTTFAVFGCLLVGMVIVLGLGKLASVKKA